MTTGKLKMGCTIVRDDTLKEDRCTLRTNHGPEAMAVINNLVLGLLLRRGVTNVPDARRNFDADPHQAWKLIAHRPEDNATALAHPLTRCTAAVTLVKVTV